MLSNIVTILSALFVVCMTYGAIVKPAETALRFGLFTTQQLADLNQ